MELRTESCGSAISNSFRHQYRDTFLAIKMAGDGALSDPSALGNMLRAGETNQKRTTKRGYQPLRVHGASSIAVSIHH
ncbi:hypothetical protein [Pararhizobium sp. O133]|uniref:hypothetical protein n=1 Tax=Pararhizobium sp. O133 TaxID=3449278 RepID=UPI003F684313